MLSPITYCLSVCDEREPEDEQLCIVVHTINNSICDTNALDNLSIKAYLSQHCLT